MFAKSLLCLFLLLAVSTLVTDAEKRRRDPRVYDAPPSDAEHSDDDDDHEGGDGDRGDDDDDEHHDPKYDKESFLGRDEAQKYDDLSPEEAKEKLGALLSKIDINNDTKITPAEMQAWLKTVAMHERARAAESRFHNIKATANAKDLDAPLAIEEYKRAMYQEIVGDEPTDKAAQESYNSQIARDNVRWSKADSDGDKLLNKTEFANFLHPEESPLMRDIVIQESMMNSDKNKDGKIDINEFMRDLYPSYEKDIKEKKKLPDWVVAEEKQFKEKLDLNKDGTLDPSEVYKWIVPDDYDHSQKETKHLFKVADENKDNVLTKEEALKKWETFVGHPATDYGNFKHEEL